MKTAVAALNLGEDLLTRLDAIAAADGRSRSNQARIFLEAALNADERLRRQFSEATSGSAAIRYGTGGVAQSPTERASGRGAPQAAELPRQGGAGDDDFAIFPHHASPSNFSEQNGMSLEKPAPRPPIDPHAELKADAIRDACAGIISRIQPKKDKQE